MTGMWHNRFMAPIYTLVISFVFAVILGVALNDPMRIHFAIPKGELNDHENVPVVVRTADDNTEWANAQLAVSQEISLLNPHKDILICLPKAWHVKNWNPASENSAQRCWYKAQEADNAQDENVEISKDQPIPPDRPKGPGKPKGHL